MDELSSRLKSITIKEVSLFTLCCVATYLVRLHQSYGLVPACRIDINQSIFENGKFAQQWEHLPSPIITDVESDDLNELLIATGEPSLQLLKIPSQHGLQTSRVLPYMKLQRETSLLTGNASPQDRQPKALATGYLEAFQSMLQLRKQVIVAVTSDWTVLCFDDQLNLQWETSLMSIDNNRYYIQEISVVVTSHNVQPGDGGLVIVGASLGDRYLKAHTVQHDHKRQKERHVHKEEEDWTDDNEDQVKEMSPVVVSHFSTFALSGNNGIIRWHHLPGDFEESRMMEKDLFSAHHFKLALRKGLSHDGEQSWTHYSQAILNCMPHRWQRGSDTLMTIDRMTKDSASLSSHQDDADATPTLPALIGLDGHHIAGYHFGGLRPHSPTEHVKNPNAVVVHMHEGIEVLDLATGRPLTRLKLNHDIATYADVDNSGTIDKIKAHFTTDDMHRDNCRAIVRSGIPPQTLLFNGSICEANSYTDALSGSLFGKKIKIRENKHLAIAPVSVKSIAKRSGVLNHLLGATNYQKSLGGRDSIFLISNGRATSYGPKGHLNWQVNTNAKWNDVLTVFKSKYYFPEETVKRYHHAFQPGLQAVTLKIYDKVDAAVLVGWDHLVIISLVDGHVITEHSLPCQPSAPVVIGDFNSDGYNDVLLQCSSGIVCFGLELYSAYWSTAFIGLCLVLVVLGMTHLCTSDYHFFEDEQSTSPYQMNHDR